MASGQSKYGNFQGRFSELILLNAVKPVFHLQREVSSNYKFTSISNKVQISQGRASLPGPTAANCPLEKHKIGGSYL